MEGLCVTPTVTPERKLDVATGHVVPSNSVQIKRLSATHRKGTERLSGSGHHLFFDTSPLYSFSCGPRPLVSMRVDLTIQAFL